MTSSVLQVPASPTRDSPATTGLSRPTYLRSNEGDRRRRGKGSRARHQLFRAFPGNDLALSLTPLTAVRSRRCARYWATEMATVKAISSRDNALLVRLRKLVADPAGYRKHGEVWLEGEHLCQAWLLRGRAVPQALMKPYRKGER